MKASREAPVSWEGARMLVKCPTCNLEFSPSVGCCPKCRVWQPERAQIVDYWVEQIRSAWSEHQSTGQIRTDLMAKRFEADAASELILVARERMRPKYRRVGMRITARALQLLVLISLSSILGAAAGLAMNWSRVVLIAIGMVGLVMGVIQWSTGWRIAEQ